MSDTATIGHNMPPTPTLAELVSASVIEAYISAELDREPPAPDGGKLKSIRARDPELEGMCKRFLAAHPKIETPDAEMVATEVLKTCATFTGKSGRIEKIREALKKPVWDAGVMIDRTFGKYGLQLIRRPLGGPIKERRAAPFTLAEQIEMRLTAYKDEKAAKIRRDAQLKADRLAAESAMVEKLAERGSGTVTMDDAATIAEAAQKQQTIANASTADLTRSHGGDFGSSSNKPIRRFTIIDPSLVARHLCKPDDALIREAIGKAGDPMPHLPGILIEDVSGLNVR